MPRTAATSTIAVGFLMGDAMAQVAKRFPKTKFAIIDFTASRRAEGQAEERRGLLFKEQEAGYLVGYLAALRGEDRPTARHRRLRSAA